MTSRSIKDLKLIVENNSILTNEKGAQIKILRFKNNVLKIHGKMISWVDFQDLLTNGNFSLKTSNGKQYFFSNQGGVRPGSGRKKINLPEKKRIQSFSLSPNLISYLDFLASHGNVSKSEIIENLLKEKLKKEKLFKTVKIN